MAKTSFENALEVLILNKSSVVGSRVANDSNGHFDEMHRQRCSHEAIPQAVVFDFASAVDGVGIFPGGSL